MRNRVSFASAGGVTLLLIAMAVSAQAQQKPSSAGVVDNDQTKVVSFVFRLLDGTTGYGVSGAVRLGRTQLPAEKCHWSPEAPEPPNVPLEERNIDASGKLEMQVRPGCYSVEVSAPGYKPFSPSFVQIQEHNQALSFSMDRLQKPEGIRRAEAALRPGMTIFYGYVADTKTLQPIAGAEVREQVVGMQAMTDAHGFFILEMPTKRAPDDGCSDILDTVSVNATGYKEEVRKNVEIYRGEVTGSNFGLEAGTGTVQNAGENSPEPAESALSAAQIEETAKWWNEAPLKPSALLDEWKARLPAIEKLLREQKFECDDDKYAVEIVGVAKLLDGPELALVDYCGMGAYTDSIVVVQLEKGKPVLSRSDDGSKLELTQGASVMHELGVQLVPEKRAIFSVGSDNDGCHLLDCWAEAYVWNSATGFFNGDNELSQLGGQSYCRHVKQELAKEVERDRPAASAGPK